MATTFHAANCKFGLPDWAVVAACQRQLFGRLTEQAAWLC